MNDTITISLFYIFLIVIWSYIYRKIVFHIFDQKASEVVYVKNNAETQVQADTNGYGKINAAELELCMKQQQPWLNPTLTLEELALALGTNRTYLSEYLNHDLGTTFYDYLNRFRIEHACRLLLSDPDKSLNMIAQESGFNSISTFRRNFEKTKSTTPAGYRKQKNETKSTDI